MQNLKLVSPVFDGLAPIKPGCIGYLLKNDFSVTGLNISSNICDFSSALINLVWISSDHDIRNLWFLLEELVNSGDRINVGCPGPMQHLCSNQYYEYGDKNFG